MMILDFHNTKIHTKIGVALKTNFISYFRVLIYFFTYVFSSITLRISNLPNKSPKIFTYDIFGLKFCIRPFMPS